MKKIVFLCFFAPLLSKGQSMFEIFSRPSKIVSANYTMGVFDVSIVVNTNTQNDTVTLPLCSSTYDVANLRSLIYHIKNIDSNYVYLKVNSGDSLEGSPNLF